MDKQKLGANLHKAKRGRDILLPVIRNFFNQKMTMKTSNCCGAEPVSNGDTDTEDLQLCPICLEHCVYEDEETLNQNSNENLPLPSVQR